MGQQRVQPALPTGTVTFLFTDIEGSTRLLQDLGAAYGLLLSDHNALLRAVTEANDGQVFGSEGDAVFAVFGTASGAVAAAVAGQRALAERGWPGGVAVRVRMGLHTGEATVVGENYVGLDLHRTARIAAAGHGGQILVSDTTRAIVGQTLPGDAVLRDLGERRLKDLLRPEHLYQVVVPGLGADFPELRTLDARPNNLPVQLTSFVGRAELETARRLLAKSRLLTLSGPGGTGKTRLALQLAAEAADDYPDGVFFVALDAIADPHLIPTSIVHALGIDPGSDPPITRLTEHLRGRRLLLVLDNFEQVVEGGLIVAGLLASAPNVKVIVTSRVVLNTSGEQEFPVPPLGMPEPAALVTAESAARSEAVRLFVERAMAASPSFALTDDNAAAIVDIVVRLDGLPLAIELAAARVRILPVEALRARLSARLAVLTGGPRDRPARQQTLRGAIDWSYDLLGRADRRLFERSAVFAGGACLAQAEAVCGPASELGEEVLDGLGSLVDKSLLKPVPGSDAEPRFAMLATIREYALERFDAAPEAEIVQRRHAEAYLALVERCSTELTGRAGPYWLDRLELDHDNLRNTLDWAVQRDEAEIALRMVAGIWRFWQIRGHLHEAGLRIDHVFALPGAGKQPALLLARAHGAAGSIAYWRGDYPEIHRHYSAALEAARQSGDRAAFAEALYNFGFAPTPEPPDANATYKVSAPVIKESLEVYRELGDARGIASANWALGTAKLMERDWAAARPYLEESLRAYRVLDDPFGTGWSLHELGLIAAFTGDLDGAEPNFREALGIFWAAKDLSAVVLLLSDFLLAAKQRGQDARYWRLAGAADALRMRTGTDLAVLSAASIGLEVPVRPTANPEADQAWLEGGLMSVAAAVEYALELMGG